MLNGLPQIEGNFASGLGAKANLPKYFTANYKPPAAELFDSGQPLTPVGHEPKSREAEASNHGPLQQFEKLKQLHSASISAQRQAVYSLARNKEFAAKNVFRKRSGLKQPKFFSQPVW